MVKYKFLSLIGILALGTAIAGSAQSYDDDIYGERPASSSASKPEQVQRVRPAAAVRGDRGYTPVQPRTQVRIERGSQLRDEDEYNRRGNNAVDTASARDDRQGTFNNTERIERFYNPDIVEGSGDDELITLYYDDTPTINLVIGSSWPYYSGYSVFYDPWYVGYNPWYDGYYSSWRLYPGWGWSSRYGGWSSRYGGWGWSRPWGWRGGWYDPWYGWGWNAGWGYWGYRDWCYDYGWRYGYDGSRWSGGRRPHGGQARLGEWSNGRRPGYAGGSGSALRARRPNVSARRGTNASGTMGRANASGGRRPSMQGRGNIGTVNRGTRRTGTVRRPSGMGRATMSSRPDSYNGGTMTRSNRSTRTYTPQNGTPRTYTPQNGTPRTYTPQNGTTRSYNSGNATRSNSSRSYSGGSRSSSGSFGGGRSGGGFSGGSHGGGRGGRR